MTPETIIALDGVEQPISEHALDWGIPAELIVQRLHDGWDKRDAIETPVKVGPCGSILPETTRRRCGRKPKTYTHDGRTMTIAEWAADAGLTRSALSKRMGAGHTLAEALGLAAHNAKLYTHDGQTMTLKEWAAHTGKKRAAIASMLQRGRTLAEAITTQNGRDAKLYTHDGQTLTLWQWSQALGLSVATLRKRLSSGLPSNVVFCPDRPQHHASIMVEYNGQTVALLDLCRAHGQPRTTVYNRLKAGWTLERALTTPSRIKAKRNGRATP